MLAARIYFRSLLVPSLVALLPAISFAAPNVQSISLRGLQIGKTTKLVFTGSDLNANPRVLLDGQALAQKVTSSAANRVEVEVTLPKEQSAGMRQLRLATDSGVSNAIAVGVDDLLQTAFTDKVTALPVAMTGTLTGGQILKMSFAGKKGQRVVAELESRRLGSNARIVVRILDPRGSQLGYSARSITLGGDARSSVVLPEDGEYSIQLHDVVYKGPSPGHFRLKVGDLKTVDFAMPLAVTAGTKSLVGFLGAKETLPLDAQNAVAGQSLAVSATGWHSTANVAVSSGKEIVEVPAEAGKPQSIPAAPIGVTGVLSDAGKEDRFLLPVKAGDRLRFEVFARRVGSPLDGVLTIRGEKGNQLAQNDDQSTTSDPRVDFTVPKNINKLMVCVSDIRARGGNGFIYRVAVHSLARPDFTLKVVADRLNIPAGGVRTLRVEATRTAYNGPISLELPGLPQDIEIAGDRIESGATFALVTLTSRHDKPFSAELRLVGKAVAAEPSLERVASLKTPPNYAATQPWLASSLAIGGSPADPIRISWMDDGASELKTHLGGDHEIAVKIDRNQGVQGDVRLKLLATQIIPKKKVKQNNKEVTIDDLDRALRLPADAKAAQADQQYTTKLLVPADLADRVWSVIIQAELLSPKTKKPVATAFTTARTLRRVQPISLEAEAGAKVEARAGGGETGSLKGKLVRVEGFHKPITITLEGLPKGYKAPTVVVPADQSEFELPVRFDGKAKPAELKNIRLIGLYRPNPKNAGLAVKTNATAVTINVVAGEPDEKKPAKQAAKK